MTSPGGLPYTMYFIICNYILYGEYLDNLRKRHIILVISTLMYIFAGLENKYSLFGFVFTSKKNIIEKYNFIIQKYVHGSRL